MSSNNNNNSSSSSSDVSLWAERIKSIQLEKSTPIVRQRILDIGSRIESRNRAVKSASRLQRCNNIATATMISTSAIQSTTKDTTLQLTDYSESSEQNSSRNDQIRSLAKRSVSVPSRNFGAPTPFGLPPNVFSFGTSPPVPINDDSDEENELLSALETEVYTSLPVSFQERNGGGGEFGQGAQFAFHDLNGSVDNSAILELLDQLKIEPTEKAELTAKFKLFEDFHETVVTIRETVYEFWEQNEHLFTVGSMRDSCKYDLKQIDSTDSMGCLDDESVWFIYHMMVKSNSNSIKISKLLSSFKTRLELLQEEPGECPICLEQIEKDNIQILGCSHKTCKSCWSNYEEFKNNRNLLCPLCRHEEFVSSLSHRDF